ncbi:MAG: 8-oxoguanine DNA glycosylase [Clostridia bacterium]|nr:8-oxoguanine DNA glycosylase [Clostridia bacterium]
MNYFIENNSIVIEDDKDFVIEHILDCGQVFRYQKVENCHTLIAKDKICILQKQNTCVILKTSEVDFFLDYFDLKRDYSEIKNQLAKYDGMTKPIEFGHGIRILNQDLYETVISFIISANNNIPRIKGIIERLAYNLGERIDGQYYAFPTAEKIIDAGIQFLEKMGCGYRAPYIYDTAKKFYDNSFDYEGIKKMNSVESRKYLLTLKGVGPKVADCIELFSLHNMDLFPMDTWSKKIYKILGFKEEANIERMERNLVNHFKELSGYAQQYLFYYYRTKNI